MDYWASDGPYLRRFDGLPGPTGSSTPGRNSNPTFTPKASANATSVDSQIGDAVH